MFRDVPIPGMAPQPKAMSGLPRWSLLILLVASAWGAARSIHAAEPQALRVMSFNLWHGGDAGRQPLGRSVDVILAGKADLVGLQETEGIARGNESRPERATELARLLGWHCLLQGGRTALLSRHPFAEITPSKWGAAIRLPSGRRVWLFNAHFPASPYQPYQLLSIPYFDAPFLKTAEEAVRAATQARGAPLERLAREISAVLPHREPVFVTGDFNEPSHQDWTPSAAAVRQCPLPVEWPTTRRMVDLGFMDGYRAAWPDPVTHRGLTWTPITREDDPKDRHDRIDFVFVRGATVRAGGAQVIGEAAPQADVVVTPYPSDHRAVVVEAWLESPRHP